MRNQALSVPTGRSRPRYQPENAQRLALDENELAARWGLSVKTLRRWRQEQLGPVFCKLGASVRYQISAIEQYERQVARFSTSARAYQ
jgi:hypothetical protein